MKETVFNKIMATDLATGCLCLSVAIFVALSSSTVSAEESVQKSILLNAARVFDGNEMRTDTSVLITDGKVEKVDSREALKSSDATVIDLGEATILPGFIELHAHHALHKIPDDTILKHGITTLRDLGGPLSKPYGGDGTLRVLSAGPILTAVDGYPIPSMGTENLAIPLSSEEQARESVRNLIAGGAAVIKIALEPGGEVGAPWSFSHGHGHGHQPESHQADPHSPSPHADKDNKHAQKPIWPMLSASIVKAIVDEAHKNNRKVTAHIGEERGAQLAIDAGVDEWAHIPCDAIPASLLAKAVAQQVKIITTIDTLSKCSGVTHNLKTLAELGADFFYGAEIAHPDIPWGIDAQELIDMMSMANMQALDALKSATAKSGKYLEIPLLGTLQKGAPADIIAVKGNPLHSFKVLEYPDLVVSGGKVVVNNFTN